jgi:hypothetical protein
VAYSLVFRLSLLDQVYFDSMDSAIEFEGAPVECDQAREKNSTKSFFNRERSEMSEKGIVSEGF